MKTLPRVLFITGSLEAGGLERFVTRVSIEGKRMNRFEPSVLCLAKKSGHFVEELEAVEIKIIEAPVGWNRSIRQWLALSKAIRQSIKPDIVHSQVNFSLIQQFLCVRLFSGAKFLVTERNCYPLQGFSLMRRFIQFYFLKVMGVHYSGNSIAVANYLSKLMKYPEEKIPVIPNGIEPILPNTDTRLRVRGKYGWPPESFVIGYVSRFAKHKGHSYFVTVMQEVVKELGPTVRLCFIGGGPTKSSIETEIERAGLTSVTTFAGVVSNIEDYYQAFDCTALLSEYEGMPNVVLEAMAYGLPVVANPVGNVVELFESGAGLLNETTEETETAKLFIRIARNNNVRIEIGKLAMERIRSDFSIQSTIQLLCMYYGL